MAISTENPAGIGRIWPFSLKTRRGLGEYDQCHAKPGEDWTNMAISTENPAGIGRIWPFSLKTRRGWDEYGHSYRKPGGNGGGDSHSYRKLVGDGINIVTAFSSLVGLGKMKCVFSTYLSRMGDEKAGRILSLVRRGFVRLACSTNWADFRELLIHGFRFFAVEANSGEVVTRNIAELATYEGHVFDQWPEGAGVVRDEYDSRLAIDLRQQVA